MLPMLIRNESSGSASKQSSPFSMPEDSEVCDILKLDLSNERKIKRS